jgi:hypothetical protein
LFSAVGFDIIDEFEVGMASQKLAHVIDAVDAQKGPFCMWWEGHTHLNQVMAKEPHLMGGYGIIAETVSNEVEGPSAVLLAVSVVASDHGKSTSELGVLDDFEEVVFELLFVLINKARK